MNVEAVGQRVEGILDQIARTTPKSADLAEDLVRELMGLYGAGLQRILDRLGGADPQAVADLTADPLVAGLMALHDLHPVDVVARVEQALEQVRPYLGSHGGGVQLLGVDGDVVRLELQGSCDGCGSSAVTVQYAVEGAIREAAPEIAVVEVSGVEAAGAELVGDAPHAGGATNLIPAESLRRRPSEVPAESGWVTLALAQADGDDEVRGHSVNGAALVVLQREGELLAYKDACARCGGSLVGGVIDGDSLRCPGCDQAFDIRLAGRAINGVGKGDAVNGQRSALAPVPLLQDGDTVRVAIGALR